MIPFYKTTGLDCMYIIYANAYPPQKKNSCIATFWSTVKFISILPSPGPLCICRHTYTF